MAKQIVLAGVVAGLVMFVWGFLWHAALGLGETGIKQIPDEETVLAAMRASIQQPGFYFFPGFDQAGHMTKEQEQAWQQKHMAGPARILIYQPHGAQPMSPAQLLTEFAKDLVMTLIMAWLLAQALPGVASFTSRVAFVTLIGLVASLETNVSYWNWYKFPGDYTAANIVEAVISFTLAGIAMAALLKRRRAGFDVSSATKSN